MLRKLIRPEFRATGRMMWPIFAAMLALTFAMRASQSVLQNDSHWLLNLLAIFIVMGFVLGFMALSLTPLVVSAVRVRDHVLREEGYLTLTLPVSMHQLLASKLIVSAVWYAAAAVFMVLLVCLLGFTDASDWLVIPNLFTEAFHLLGKLDASTRAQAIFFAVEFFQLVQFAAIAVLAQLFDDGFTAWSSLTGVQAGNAFLAAALAGELAVCVLFYLITWYFITKKLNLE